MEMKFLSMDPELLMELEVVQMYLVALSMGLEVLPIEPATQAILSMDPEEVSMEEASMVLKVLPKKLWVVSMAPEDLPMKLEMTPMIHQ
jgi:hypothetical protein